MLCISYRSHSGNQTIPTETDRQYCFHPGSLLHLDVKNLEKFLPGGFLYCKSKHCNILFTMELASRLKGTSVTAYSLHPGIISTGLPKQALSWAGGLYPFYMNEVEGAQTTIHCSVADGIETLSGEHFHNCQRHRRYLNCRDGTLAKNLWIETEKIVKLK